MPQDRGRAGASSGPGRNADEQRVHRNLYRIDDLLIRAGAIALLAVAAAGVALVVVGLAGRTGVDDPRPVVSGGRIALLVLAGACPIGLLAGGFAIRRREKRTLAFWRLMQQNVEIHVPDLVANSDHTRADIARSVRLLNNKALGFWVWDPKSDVIRDGRLEAAYLHVEKCDGCQARIGLRVHASLREVPSCPYCGDPVSVESLLALKRDAIDAMRAENPPPRSRERGLGPEPISIGIFLLLLFTFWPAALVYGLYKWHARSDS